MLDGKPDAACDRIARCYPASRTFTLPEPQGPAHARNLGLRMAQGEWVLFLDSDVAIHSDAISRIVDRIRNNPNLDAIFGAYDDMPTEPGFVSQYRNLLHCFTHRHARRDACTFWTGCGAVRKEAFLRCGGLDERYDRPAVEDIEFGLRLRAAGGRILLDPAIQVTHLKRWSLAGMIRTDIFDRGVPWTKLILRGRSMPDDLNLRWSQRASVALSAVSVAALASGSLKIALASALTLLCLNLPFLSFLLAKRGAAFALRALPVHFLFHFYSGIAFALGLGSHLLGSWRGSPSAAATEETP